MERVSLNVEPRETKGSGAAQRLRREGIVPAILYGHDIQPQSLKVKSLEIEKAYQKGANALVNLAIGKENQLAIISEVQKEVLTGKIRHVDFHRIKMTDKLHISVAIHLEGEAPGVKTDGGQLEFIHRHLMVECLPGDIPDAIKVAVTSLRLNEAIHIKDLALPKGVKALGPADEVIVRVTTIKVIEEAAPAPAAAATEAAPAAAAAPAPAKK